MAKGSAVVLKGASQGDESEDLSLGFLEKVGVRC